MNSAEIGLYPWKAMVSWSRGDLNVAGLGLLADRVEGVQEVASG